MNRVLRTLTLSAMLLGLTTFSAFADTGSPIPPCLGFNPRDRTWGMLDLTLTEPEASCAPGYAIISAGFGGGRARNASEVRVMGSCCKLPDGALLDVHVYDASACPSSFVATGIRMERARGAELSYLLRCTKIDESRFALGEPQPASYVGWTRNFIQHYALAFLGRDEKRVIRSSLPLGIRYAVGRRGEFTWDLATCVGDPPGALLTEKLDKHCADLRFRRLLAIDAAAPPPEIYPSCNIISSITDPEGRCLDSTNAN